MQRDGPPRPSVCQMTGRIKCKDEKKKKKKSLWEEKFQERRVATAKMKFQNLLCSSEGKNGMLLPFHEAHKA